MYQYEECKERYSDLVDKYNENKIPRYITYSKEEQLNFSIKNDQKRTSTT